MHRFPNKLESVAKPSVTVTLRPFTDAELFVCESFVPWQQGSVGSTLKDTITLTDP